MNPGSVNARIKYNITPNKINNLMLFNQPYIDNNFTADDETPKESLV